MCADLIVEQSPFVFRRGSAEVQLFLHGAENINALKVALNTLKNIKIFKIFKTASKMR